MSGKCVVCLEAAVHQCAGCKNVFYCGKDHQKKHWSSHRSDCRPVRVQEHPVLGRHLVASRDIAQGELIIRELPLVLGPRIASTPICLGCCQEADVSCPCPGCGWPLCSITCSSAPAHQAECDLMQARGYRAEITNANRPLPDYAFITPLRALLLPPNKLKTLKSLQSHLETRKKSHLYNLLKFNVAGFLQNKLGLNLSDDEILEACAILDTNAFEMRSGKMRFRGLFPLVAMMAHDCIPNTRHTFDSKNALQLFATESIKKGQSITATYTQPFWSTMLRRAHLRSAKCFECSCQRCSDPEEMDTFVSAVKCTNCEGMMVSNSPLDDSASWTCKNCGIEASASQMIWLNNTAKEEIDALDKRKPDQLEAFLEKYKDIFHPTNGHVLQVKFALAHIYGNADCFSLNELSEEQIDRKIDLAQELLQVMATLEPGASRTRAQLQIELQPTKVHKAKLDFEVKKLGFEAAKLVLNEAIAELNSAVAILKTDPELAVKANANLHQVLLMNNTLLDCTA